MRRLIALAGAALVLVGGATAHAAEKAIWGPVRLPDGSSAFPVYEALSADVLQAAISWDEVAPVRPSSPRDPDDPAYRWPPDIATAAAEGRRSDIRIALMVRGSPRWANGGRSAIWAPTRARDYADFLTAAARRYPAVRRWMIWGEPNKDNRFQPNQVDRPSSARAYARLLDAAYGALKRADSHNIVIGGNTWTNGTVKPRDFVRWMRLPSGRRPRLDWFGHNPFPFRFPRLSAGPIAGGFRDISDADTFSHEVQRAYGRIVPLWLSEYTIQTARGSDLFATFVSEPAQARYLTAGYAIADELGSRVAGLGWLALHDEPAAAGSANWGLMTYGLRHKPSFAALARARSERLRPRVALTRSMRGAGLHVQVRVTPRRDGVIRIELRRGGRRLASSSVLGRRDRPRAVALRRASAATGLYTVVVRTGHGATVRRKLRVRTWGDRDRQMHRESAHWDRLRATHGLGRSSGDAAGGAGARRGLGRARPHVGSGDGPDPDKRAATAELPDHGPPDPRVRRR